MLMPTDFEILTSFLDQFNDEVGGRTLTEPDEEMRAKLRAFARGELPETEREALVSALNENPGWVEILAEEAKRARREGESGSVVQ